MPHPMHTQRHLQLVLHDCAVPRTARDPQTADTDFKLTGCIACLTRKMYFSLALAG